MLIAYSGKFNSENLWRSGVRAAWILSILIIAGFIGLFLGSGNGDMSQEQVMQQVGLEKIGEGALALQSFSDGKIGPDLKEEVFLLAGNFKPVKKEGVADLWLKLRSSGEELRCRNGEQIFLRCDPLAGGAHLVYHRSHKETPFWIKPNCLKDRTVLVEVGYASGDGELASSQFILREEASSLEEHLDFLEPIRGAKFLGKDLLLSQRAPQRYKSLQDKVKIEIAKGGKSAVYFLGIGDMLEWTGEEWVPYQNGESGENPLAKVVAVTPRSMEFQVWDGEGFVCLPVKLEQQAQARPPAQIANGKVETLPQTVRLRTSKQISCSFGKKRFLLREGDWILKTSRGWRVLRRSMDKDNYLELKIRGELLIFDALVQEQGKWTMKGVRVDEMRTAIQPFSVPVTGDSAAKKLQPHKEKRSLFPQQQSSPVVSYFPKIAEDGGSHE